MSNMDDDINEERWDEEFAAEELNKSVPLLASPAVVESSNVKVGKVLAAAQSINANRPLPLPPPPPLGVGSRKDQQQQQQGRVTSVGNFKPLSLNVPATNKLDIAPAPAANNLHSGKQPVTFVTPSTSVHVEDVNEEDDDDYDDDDNGIVMDGNDDIISNDNDQEDDVDEEDDWDAQLIIDQSSYEPKHLHEPGSMAMSLKGLMGIGGGGGGQGGGGGGNSGVDEDGAAAGDGQIPAHESLLEFLEAAVQKEMFPDLFNVGDEKMGEGSDAGGKNADSHDTINIPSNRAYNQATESSYRENSELLRHQQHLKGFPEWLSVTSSRLKTVMMTCQSCNGNGKESSFSFKFAAARQASSVAATNNVAGSSTDTFTRGKILKGTSEVLHCLAAEGVNAKELLEAEMHLSVTIDSLGDKKGVRYSSPIDGGAIAAVVYESLLLRCEEDPIKEDCVYSLEAVVKWIRSMIHCEDPLENTSCGSQSVGNNNSAKSSGLHSYPSCSPTSAANVRNGSNNMGFSSRSEDEDSGLGINIGGPHLNRKASHSKSWYGSIKRQSSTTRESWTAENHRGGERFDANGNVSTSGKDQPEQPTELFPGVTYKKFDKIFASCDYILNEQTQYTTGKILQLYSVLLQALSSVPEVGASAALGGGTDDTDVSHHSISATLAAFGVFDDVELNTAIADMMRCLTTQVHLARIQMQMLEIKMHVYQHVDMFSIMQNFHYLYDELETIRTTWVRTLLLFLRPEEEVAAVAMNAAAFGINPAHGALDGSNHGSIITGTTTTREDYSTIVSATSGAKESTPMSSSPLVYSYRQGSVLSKILIDLQAICIGNNLLLVSRCSPITLQKLDSQLNKNSAYAHSNRDGDNRGSFKDGRASFDAKAAQQQAPTSSSSNNNRTKKSKMKTAVAEEDDENGQQLPTYNVAYELAICNRLALLLQKIPSPSVTRTKLCYAAYVYMQQLHSDLLPWQQESYYKLVSMEQTIEGYRIKNINPLVVEAEEAFGIDSGEINTDSSKISVLEVESAILRSFAEAFGNMDSVRTMQWLLFIASCELHPTPATLIHGEEYGKPGTGGSVGSGSHGGHPPRGGRARRRGSANVGAFDFDTDRGGDGSDMAFTTNSSVASGDLGGGGGLFSRGGGLNGATSLAALQAMVFPHIPIAMDVDQSIHEKILECSWERDRAAQGHHHHHHQYSSSTPSGIASAGAPPLTMPPGKSSANNSNNTSTHDNSGATSPANQLYSSSPTGSGSKGKLGCVNNHLMRYELFALSRVLFLQLADVIEELSPSYSLDLQDLSIVLLDYIGDPHDERAVCERAVGLMAARLNRNQTALLYLTPVLHKSIKSVLQAAKQATAAAALSAIRSDTLVDDTSHDDSFREQKKQQQKQQQQQKHKQQSHDRSHRGAFGDVNMRPAAASRGPSSSSSSSSPLSFRSTKAVNITGKMSEMIYVTQLVAEQFMSGAQYEMAARTLLSTIDVLHTIKSGAMENIAMSVYLSMRGKQVKPKKRWLSFGSANKTDSFNNSKGSSKRTSRPTSVPGPEPHKANPLKPDLEFARLATPLFYALGKVYLLFGAADRAADAMQSMLVLCQLRSQEGESLQTCATDKVNALSLMADAYLELGDWAMCQKVADALHVVRSRTIEAVARSRTHNSTAYVAAPLLKGFGSCATVADAFAAMGQLSCPATSLPQFCPALHGDDLGELRARVYFAAKQHAKALQCLAPTILGVEIVGGGKGGTKEALLELARLYLLKGEIQLETANSASEVMYPIEVGSNESCGPVRQLAMDALMLCGRQFNAVHAHQSTRIMHTSSGPVGTTGDAGLAASGAAAVSGRGNIKSTRRYARTNVPAATTAAASAPPGGSTVNGRGANSTTKAVPGLNRSPNVSTTHIGSSVGGKSGKGGASMYRKDQGFIGVVYYNPSDLLWDALKWFRRAWDLFHGAGDEVSAAKAASNVAKCHLLPMFAAHAFFHAPVDVCSNLSTVIYSDRKRSSGNWTSSFRPVSTGMNSGAHSQSFNTGHGGIFPAESTASAANKQNNNRRTPPDSFHHQPGAGGGTAGHSTQQGDVVYRFASLDEAQRVMRYALDISVESCLPLMLIDAQINMAELCILQGSHYDAVLFWWESRELFLHIFADSALIPLLRRATLPVAERIVALLDRLVRFLWICDRAIVNQNLFILDMHIAATSELARVRRRMLERSALVSGAYIDGGPDGDGVIGGGISGASAPPSGRGSGGGGAGNEASASAANRDRGVAHGESKSGGLSSESGGGGSSSSSNGVGSSGWSSTASSVQQQQQQQQQRNDRQHSYSITLLLEAVCVVSCSETMGSAGTDRAGTSSDGLNGSNDSCPGAYAAVGSAEANPHPTDDIASTSRDHYAKMAAASAPSSSFEPAATNGLLNTVMKQYYSFPQFAHRCSFDASLSAAQFCNDVNNSLIRDKIGNFGWTDFVNHIPKLVTDGARQNSSFGLASASLTAAGLGIHQQSSGFSAHSGKGGSQSLPLSGPQSAVARGVTADIPPVEGTYVFVAPSHHLDYKYKNVPDFLKQFILQRGDVLGEEEDDEFEFDDFDDDRGEEESDDDGIAAGRNRSSSRSPSDNTQDGDSIDTSVASRRRRRREAALRARILPEEPLDPYADFEWMDTNDRFAAHWIPSAQDFVSSLGTGVPGDQSRELYQVVPGTGVVPTAQSSDLAAAAGAAGINGLQLVTARLLPELSAPHKEAAMPIAAKFTRASSTNTQAVDGGSPRTKMQRSASISAAAVPANPEGANREHAQQLDRMGENIQLRRVWRSFLLLRDSETRYREGKCSMRQLRRSVREELSSQSCFMLRLRAFSRQFSGKITAYDELLQLLREETRNIESVAGDLLRMKLEMMNAVNSGTHTGAGFGANSQAVTARKVEAKRATNLQHRLQHVVYAVQVSNLLMLYRPHNGSQFVQLLGGAPYVVFSDVSIDESPKSGLIPSARRPASGERRLTRNLEGSGGNLTSLSWSEASGSQGGGGTGSTKSKEGSNASESPRFSAPTKSAMRTRSQQSLLSSNGTDNSDDFNIYKAPSGVTKSLSLSISQSRDTRDARADSLGGDQGGLVPEVLSKSFTLQTDKLQARAELARTDSIQSERSLMRSLSSFTMQKANSNRSSMSLTGGYAPGKGVASDSLSVVTHGSKSVSRRDVYNSIQKHMFRNLAYLTFLEPIASTTASSSSGGAVSASGKEGGTVAGGEKSEKHKGGDGGGRVRSSSNSVSRTILTSTQLAPEEQLLLLTLMNNHTAPAPTSNAAVDSAIDSGYSTAAANARRAVLDKMQSGILQHAIRFLNEAAHVEELQSLNASWDEYLPPDTGHPVDDLNVMHRYSHSVARSQSEKVMSSTGKNKNKNSQDMDAENSFGGKIIKSDNAEAGTTVLVSAPAVPKRSLLSGLKSIFRTSFRSTESSDYDNSINGSGQRQHKKRQGSFDTGESSADNDEEGEEDGDDEDASFLEDDIGVKRGGGMMPHVRSRRLTSTSPVHSNVKGAQQAIRHSPPMQPLPLTILCSQELQPLPWELLLPRSRIVRSAHLTSLCAFVFSYDAPTVGSSAASNYGSRNAATLGGVPNGTGGNNVNIRGFLGPKWMNTPVLVAIGYRPIATPPETPQYRSSILSGASAAVLAAQGNRKRLTTGGTSSSSAAAAGNLSAVSIISSSSSGAIIKDGVGVTGGAKSMDNPLLKESKDGELSPQQIMLFRQVHQQLVSEATSLHRVRSLAAARNSLKPLLLQLASSTGTGTVSRATAVAAAMNAIGTSRSQRNKPSAAGEGGINTHGGALISTHGANHSRNNNNNNNSGNSHSSRPSTQQPSPENELLTNIMYSSVYIGSRWPQHCLLSEQVPRNRIAAKGDIRAVLLPPLKKPLKLAGAAAVAAAASMLSSAASSAASAANTAAAVSEFDVFDADMQSFWGCLDNRTVTGGGSGSISVSSSGVMVVSGDGSAAAGGGGGGGATIAATSLSTAGNLMFPVLLFTLTDLAVGCEAVSYIAAHRPDAVCIFAPSFLLEIVAAEVTEALQRWCTEAGAGCGVPATSAPSPWASAKEASISMRGANSLVGPRGSQFSAPRSSITPTGRSGVKAVQKKFQQLQQQEEEMQLRQQEQSSIWQADPSPIQTPGDDSTSISRTMSMQRSIASGGGQPLLARNRRTSAVMTGGVGGGGGNAAAAAAGTATTPGSTFTTPANPLARGVPRSQSVDSGGGASTKFVGARSIDSWESGDDAVHMDHSMKRTTTAAAARALGAGSPVSDVDSTPNVSPRTSPRFANVYPNKGGQHQFTRQQQQRQQSAASNRNRNYADMEIVDAEYVEEENNYWGLDPEALQSPHTSQRNPQQTFSRPEIATVDVPDAAGTGNKSDKGGSSTFLSRIFTYGQPTPSARRNSLSADLSAMATAAREAENLNDDSSCSRLDEDDIDEDKVENGGSNSNNKNEDKVNIKKKKKNSGLESSGGHLRDRDNISKQAGEGYNSSSSSPFPLTPEMNSRGIAAGSGLVTPSPVNSAQPDTPKAGRLRKSLVIDIGRSASVDRGGRTPRNLTENHEGYSSSGGNHVHRSNSRSLDVADPSSGVCSTAINERVIPERRPSGRPTRQTSLRRSITASVEEGGDRVERDGSGVAVGVGGAGNGPVTPPRINNSEQEKTWVYHALMETVHRLQQQHAVTIAVII